MNPWKFLLTLTDPRRPVTMRTMLLVALVSVVVDQLTKLWAVAALDPSGRPVSVIPNLLALRLVHNPGAAFSMFSGQAVVLAAVSLVISIAILVWGWKLPTAERGMRVALGLVLGGAIGNLIDRIRLRHVIDFIDAHWFWKAHWPTFNIADTAVCVGVGLLIWATSRVTTKAGSAAPDCTDRSDARH